MAGPLRCALGFGRRYREVGLLGHAQEMDEWAVARACGGEPDLTSAGALGVQLGARCRRTRAPRPTMVYLCSGLAERNAAAKRTLSAFFPCEGLRPHAAMAPRSRPLRVSCLLEQVNGGLRFLAD